MSRRPDDIARELGLEFTAEPSHDKRWLRFAFQFPEFTRQPMQGNSVAPPKPIDAEAIRAAQERAKSPEGQKFAAVVSRVTAWRKRVEAWIVDPAPPGEQGVFVAAELSFGNRFRVASVNRANRKALRKFNDPEALARRAAMAQTTPEAALKALAETLKMYGIKQPGAETVELRKKFETAAAIVALDGNAVPKGVTYQ